MKKVLICGASRGLGLACVKQLLNEDIQPVAMVRNSDNSALLSLPIQIEQGDALNPQDIEAILNKHQDLDGIISTMGSFNTKQAVDYLGHRILIEALANHPCQRLLMVTSLGCGDSWRWMSERSKAGFGQAVREKSLAEAWLQSSELDFTIVRPGGLKEGEVSQTGELSQGKEVHGLISRAEVARLIVPLLSDNSAIGQVYACVDPEHCV